MYLAFDVYGTLIDTAGVTDELYSWVGECASEFSRCWRDKQLEYSFRRGLMQFYCDFSVCTRQALDYTCELFNISLSREQGERLMALYKHLPAFPDAVSGLKKLKELPLRIFAFSNGRPDDLDSLLRGAGILHYFEGVVSLLEAHTFKPNPAAYTYFHRSAQTGGAETWLISSNPFDVIGALSSGMKSTWIKRSLKAVFDPWGIQPTTIVSSLDELADFWQRNLISV